MSAVELRALAFYLPQFHPIPENDAWWGAGFTEWTNVTKARPRFRSHYQPHLPANLGYYDLRLPETRLRQAELAREYGLAGFCYYHYWFGGRRLLERPFEEVRKSGEPDLPFVLCWANENWTRVWDGGSGKELIKQQYSDEDDRAHMRHLAGAFRDRRYIRVDGRPVFLVYRAGLLPDARRTTDIWRREAEALGLPGLYLCKVEAFAQDRDRAPEADGFDAAVDFAPDWGKLPRPLRSNRFWRTLQRAHVAQQGYRRNRVYDYRSVVSAMDSRPTPPYKRFACVTPSWDNSARRREDAVILHRARPEVYEDWLARTAQASISRGDELLFVNAWNEWAEGSHLEPDERFGLAWLEATREGLRRGTAPTGG